MAESVAALRAGEIAVVVAAAGDDGDGAGGDDAAAVVRHCYGGCCEWEASLGRRRVPTAPLHGLVAHVRPT